jgi:CHAT domain-containing protein/Tfp pilus assembly protein PilF
MHIIIALAGSVMLVMCTAQARARQTAQDKQPATALEIGKPVERELAGGEAHTYLITLAAGQYLGAVVDQRGIDVVVRLYGPDGKILVEVDSPNGTMGPEPVSLVTEAAGSYRLDVVSSEKGAPVGRYTVKVVELRSATAQDKNRVAAQLISSEAGRLHDQGAKEAKLKAIERYKESLPLWEAAGDTAGKADALHGMGLCYQSLGEYQKALEVYGQALVLRRAAGNRRGEADLLFNTGLVLERMGEWQKALDALDQALSLMRAVGERAGEALVLSTTGLIYDALGEKQKALDLFNQALPLVRAAGNRYAEATALANIGYAYYSLDQPQAALAYFDQSLSLMRALGHRGGEAIALHNLGLAHNSLGHTQMALDFFQQSLALRQAAGNRSGEARTLTAIGGIYNSLGEKQKALDYYQRALALRRASGDREGEAITLTDTAAIYYSLGDKEKALELLSQSLPLMRSIRNASGEAVTLYRMARIERDRGRLPEARAQIETAINIAESIRGRLISPELRASYFASVSPYYSLYIDVLMKSHALHPAEGANAIALQASERARARSLLELLMEARADIRQGADPLLLQRERALQHMVNIKAEQQFRLLGARHTQEQADTVAKQLAALIAEYEQVKAEIRQKSPRYAALTQPAPLGLKEIQSLLDPDTLLLEYALGDEKSYLWVVSPTSLASYELPARAQIEKQARQVYQLLTARNRREQGETAEQQRARVAEAEAEYPKAAMSLSHLLLGPLAGQLGTKRLLIVGDGALHYIPFGALPVPGSAAATGQRGSFLPLIVDHEIVSLPSASVLAALRRDLSGRKKRAARSVAVLADPVFDPEDNRVRAAVAARARPAEAVAATARPDTVAQPVADVARAIAEIGVADASASIPRLPFSRREAEAILALTPANAGMKALDFKASRATATSSDLAQYRIIHFATHGLLNSEHPELSGIILSLVDEQGRPVNGFLRLHEVYNLSLGAELVVLSACQTGLGKEIKGEGLVGLVRGFMYAGAPRVVASLWKIDDVATEELMRRFYRRMLKDGQRPAEALRGAQIEMWREPRWQAPYYWAGFILQGEWK